jgi:hypothetical protein
MSFTVTATFATAQEAANFLAGTNAAQTVSAPEKAAAAVIAKAATSEKPKAAPPAAVPAASAAPAPTTAQEPAAAAKPKADSVDYPTLQKAVFKLAGISRDEAGAAAKAFGVNTFKELPSEKWGEALKSVEAKIAELSEAVA